MSGIVYRRPLLINMCQSVELCVGILINSVSFYITFLKYIVCHFTKAVTVNFRPT